MGLHSKTSLMWTIWGKGDLDFQSNKNANNHNIINISHIFKTKVF
jgi:hypothetical protein